MRGDFSRLTYRPARHYSSVRLQQGRVQVDADWNEQVDIALHRDEVLTRDVVGPAGVPLPGEGFAVGLMTIPRRTSGVAFPSASAGFAVGDDTTILATTDGGATWSRQAVPADVRSRLRAVDFPSASVGYAVGDDATILGTTDGGATWSRQTAPAGLGSDLRAAKFVSASTGFAVGDDATVITTTDGGATWNRQTLPAGVISDLRAIAATSAAAALTVGDDATILATADGGATWTRQNAPSGTTSNLAAVAFPSATAGFAVGDDATILATTDGGATWSRQSVPADVISHLRSVAFTSPTTGFAVGDDATILTTADGGATWTRQNAPSGTTSDLRAIAFPSATSGFAVGDDGTILATSDGGATWTRQIPPQELGIGRGRIYVDGVLAENDVPVPVVGQPDLPGGAAPTTDGRYLFYLDVWQRHVTAVERPDLREVALGGPDTATRTQTVWQVKWEAANGKTCADFGADWVTGKVEGRGLLAARATPGPPGTDPCEVPPGAGYRRLENQLYRVEVHDPTASGNPTYKWSRDNGSVMANVVGSDSAGITISGPEKDGIAGFGGAQFAEIRDDERELTEMPGDLVPVVVHRELLTLGSGASVSPPGTNASARRWESDATALTPDVWVELEDGVEVRFAGGDYRSGDYWTIPARTVTATVEWPSDEFGPLFEPPHGVRHHYAPLGILDKTGATWAVADDCRSVFPPLTGLLGLYVAGGDGQESMPGQPLPQSVRVWGPTPGSRVRFTAQGNGIVAATPAGAVGASTHNLVVTTGADRVASCGWMLDPAGTASQTLTATLVDTAGQPFGVPVVFDGNFSLASQVAYDPSKCANLAGASTVQEAIDVLCTLRGEDGGEEPGIHVDSLTLVEIDRDLSNDTIVTVGELEGGINVFLDGSIDPVSVRGKPVCSVTIEMPYPLTPADMDFWGGPPVVAFQPLVLAAEVSGHENILRWRPPVETIDWLSRLLSMMQELGRGDRVLARLTIFGNFIWSQDDAGLFVDGDSFGAPDGSGRTDLLRNANGLLSGDSRRGGDFRMWFWLANERRHFDRLQLVPVIESNFINSKARRRRFPEAVSLAFDRNAARAAFGEHMTFDLDAPFDLAAAIGILDEIEVSDHEVNLIAERSIEELAALLAENVQRIRPNLVIRPLADIVRTGERLFTGNRPADLILAPADTIQRLDERMPGKISVADGITL